MNATRATLLTVAFGFAVFVAMFCLEQYMLRPTLIDHAINAIANNDEIELAKLLDEIDINTQIYDPNPILSGSTLLMHATELVNYDIVALLLEKGANPTLRRGDGTAAIHIAASSSPSTAAKQQESLEILKALSVYHETINYRSAFIDPPLYLVAVGENPLKYEKAKILIESGGETTFPMRVDQQKIWDWIKDDQEMIRILKGNE